MNYLDRNEFNFEPSPLVRQAVESFRADDFCFYTRIYDRGLKSIFSEYLSALYGVPEAQVLIGYGAEDLLKDAVHYFLTAGSGGNDTIMIPRYSWWYYKSIADEVDGSTVSYPLIEGEEAFDYDLMGLIKAVNEQRPRVLLVASPNNPTGNALTPEQLRHLLESIPQETVLLVDEAYASFVTSDTSYIAPLVRDFGNVVILRTLSKFYGLPGLRLGFGFIGRSALMERFARYTNKYLGYDRLSEAVGIAALKSDDYYRHVAEVMQQGRERYHERLGALPGFKVYRSSANFILIRYPIELKAALKKALGEKDYQIKFMDEPDLHSHMRITLGREEQNRAVCDTIEAIAKAQR